MTNDDSGPASSAGVFDLETPSDLMHKMARELERLRGDPSDADHAFNFFVTAEHDAEPLGLGQPYRERCRRLVSGRLD